MKKISVLIVAFVTLSLSSCGGSDDDNESASIVGKWEYFQEGEIVNGVEMLDAYSHTEGCSKDYIEFKSNGTFDDVWYDMTTTGCASDNDGGTWTQTGTAITTTYQNDDAPETGEILILDANTLKVKFVDNSNGVSETYITVLKR